MTQPCSAQKFWSVRIMPWKLDALRCMGLASLKRSGRTLPVRPRQINAGIRALTALLHLFAGAGGARRNVGAALGARHQILGHDLARTGAARGLLLARFLLHHRAMGGGDAGAVFE